MELINPNGDRFPIKPEGDPKKPAGTDKPVDPAYAFKADFNTPGWMKLEFNMEMISHSREAQWKMMGFFDDHKGIALQIIANIIAQRQAVKTELNKTQNKNGFRGFLHRLGR